MIRRGAERRGIGLAAAATAAVAAAIVGALALVRDPWSERDWRADLERMHALDRFADAVDCHWRLRGSLPEDKDDLVDLAAPADAASLSCRRTSGLYDRAAVDRLCPDCAYRPLSDQRYEICTKFASDMRGLDLSLHPRISSRRDWRHAPGRACFELTASAAN